MFDADKQAGIFFQYPGFSTFCFGLFCVCSVLEQIAELTCVPVSLVVISFKNSVVMRFVCLILFCFLLMCNDCLGFLILEVVVWRF